MILLTALAARAAETSWGYDLANLDRSASPCTDFYQFAVGGWQRTHPIPAAYARWTQFNIVVKRNDEILRQLLEQDAATHAVAGNERKLGDFYASGIDEAAVESAGLKPLQPYLQRIDAMRDASELGPLVADLQLAGADELFDLDAGPDPKNSDMVIADLGQGGLGLPDRDYYTKTDAESVKTREQYLEHVSKMLALSGSQDTAQVILDLETQLANASMTRVQRRDPQATYHKMTFAEVAKMMPHMNWAAYLSKMGLSEATAVNVNQPDFFTHLDGLVTSVPLSTWKIYLRWHLVHSMAAFLTKGLVAEDFRFYGQTLQGTKEMLPRWKRVLDTINGGMGFALGKQFVAKTFPPQAKQRALAMVSNLRACLRDDIERLDWMGSDTKKAAQEKLAAFHQKIGYPDKWRDYSALRIDRGSYAGNVMRAEGFEMRRRLRQIGQPPDRTEWHMTPQTVNAYYDPNLNEIVFPAGILQPPFFNAQAEDVVNYGGIGAVIGHEMTHGFDDKGAQYDARGNLRNWWSAEDLKRFQERAACVESEFEGFYLEPKIHLQGKLVEGEAIADLGGVTLAWLAWKKSLEGKPAPPLRDGFTPEQRFFLAYAQIWAANLRPQYARLMANVDPHPMPRFRVNGTVSNMQPFWEAFGCKAGEPMIRTENAHCAVW